MALLEMKRGEQESNDRPQSEVYQRLKICLKMSLMANSGER